MSNGSRIRANIHSNIQNAHGATAKLVLYFFLATFIIVILMDILVVVIVPAVYNATITEPENAIEMTGEARAGLSIIVSILTVLFLLGAWGFSYLANSSFTGVDVAENMGARLVQPNTSDAQERQLLDIVQELCSRFGIAMPPVYIQNTGDINAFAAGLSPRTAAVGVTLGSMRLFTREELTCVLGHELGHVINGDSRLKLNMGCAASGFSFVHWIGDKLLIKAQQRQDVSEMNIAMEQQNAQMGIYDEQTHNKNDQIKGGSAAFLVLAAGVFALGFIGFKVGQLILYAISRQREFLADLTAAKMTGNPEAMAHALMKIKLACEGDDESMHIDSSPERNAYAQFYFAPVSSWYNTHPDTNERIRQLLPNYNGVIPSYIKQQFANPPGLTSERTGGYTSSYSSDSPFPGMAMGLAGNNLAQAPAPQSSAPQFDFLQTQAQQPQQVVTPQEPPKPKFIDFIRAPYSARCAIFALLIDANQEVRMNQWNYLQHTLDSSLLKLVQKLLPVAIKYSCAEKISMAEKSLYALQQMTISQYKDFRKIVNELTAADQRLDLFELTLRCLITGRLDYRYGLNKNAVKFTKASQLGNEFQIMLGYVAYSGADNMTDAQGAFAHACNSIRCKMPMPEKSSCNLSSFAKALAKIQFASTPIKAMFFNAFIDCINYDGKVTTRERELVYALGAALDLRFDLD
ncbi:MAG: M48 family metalloprotease [Thermoguttaceae bacterium]|nr:M48 family metalloprotease [Thermoguttaceae bacterium]